jgi:hypothetical protein
MRLASLRAHRPVKSLGGCAVGYPGVCEYGADSRAGTGDVGEHLGQELGQGGRAVGRGRVC